MERFKLKYATHQHVILKIKTKLTILGSQHIVNKCIDKDTKESVIDNRCLYVGSKTDEPVKCERKPCDAET